MLVKIETAKVGESKIQCKDLGSVQKCFRLVPWLASLARGKRMQKYAES
jgi:hypothetical protein